MGNEQRADKEERREKNRVTVVSVAAAVVLTCAKLAAGLLTGSLGLLAEAAHSGLDTVSTVVTFFSVRIAGRPADVEHPYGHGRFENLSAIIEGVLLIVTAAWILYESVHRIFFAYVAVEPSAWAFAVMLVSIAVDFARSTMLSKAARKYDSRALEADALNFRADMLSSAVVIAGLALVAYADATGSGNFFLNRADAFAALFVGLFIIFKSAQLAVRSVNVLLDLAPVDLQEKITRSAGSVPGVVETRMVRIRESGQKKFADIVVTVPRTVSTSEAHEISEKVEEAVRGVDRRTESVVHVEPVMTDTETLAESIHATALQMGLRTHHERVQRSGEKLEASLHLEVDSGLTLEEAHALANRLGREIRTQYPELSRVNTHIEVAEPESGERREITGEHADLVKKIKQAVEESGVGARCHEVRLYRAGEELDAVLHCDFPGSTNIGAVHIWTEQMEQTLRERFPRLEHVVIHAEPREVQSDS